MKHWPFKVVDKNGKPAVEVMVGDEKKSFSPEEIYATVLRKMKAIAESLLNETVSGAVLTVPQYFSDAQREATKAAGTMAGMAVWRIIPEPRAAAIAYALDKRGGSKNILVFHLGGGTCDATLMNVEDGVFEVLASSADTNLGGDNFDQRVMRYFTKLFKSKHGRDISEDTRALQKLRREVERVKHTLSATSQARNPNPNPDPKP